jgi:hypothetical protein
MEMGEIMLRIPPKRKVVADQGKPTLAPSFQIDPMNLNAIDDFVMDVFVTWQDMAKAIIGLACDDKNVIPARTKASQIGVITTFSG